MKVGLMTCYVNNYGACLQAFALQQAIKRCGNDCEIIRYTPYADLARQFNIKQVSQPMAVRIKRTIRHPIQLCMRRIDRKKQLIRNVKFESFRKENLVFADRLYESWDELRSDPPEYDAFVCGSDQIWNPVIHHSMNVGPYFLDFAPDSKRTVAYAPSIGVEVVPEECKADMKRLIDRLDAVSVRELHGAELIKDISGRDARVVLDPTLLFDGEWWSKAAKPVQVRKPYILCYLFNENKSTYDYVQRIKKKTGYEVVTLPFAFSDIYSKNKKIYDAGPAEFLYLIKNAEFIITDSFHATAFSINFNKDFVCLFRNTHTEKNNMNSRITSILSLSGLENRIISDPDVENDIPPSIEYSEVNKRMNDRRESDLSFLNNSLSGGTT